MGLLPPTVIAAKLYPIVGKSADPTCAVRSAGMNPYGFTYTLLRVLLGVYNPECIIDPVKCEVHAMFKSKAKQRAYEAFLARQTFVSKTQKRKDFRSRVVHNTLESERAIACSTVQVVVCKPHMPKGTFAGTVQYKNKSHKTYIPHSLLNTKKSKSVADPLQSWVAHY